MNSKVDIPGTLQRLATLVSQMGYECEVVDDELFVFTASVVDDYGDEITININVTANGENKHIGQGNYIAFEVFIPCAPVGREEELQICYYIMQLIMEVDLTTIQYVPKTQQILISRVDCITPELPDGHIIEHVIRPTINEFLHIFTLIEAPQKTDEGREVQPSSRYLN
ncbi:MAG: hypothetical protein IJ442_02200 [Bacteroidaceae bacterium]|nr:hypothetical protein [Bacteroidaceae bacterium]